jgi:ABC-type lipoprotein release transport system permease subunit
MDQFLGSRPQPLPAATSRGETERRFVQLRGVEDPRVAAAVHGLDLLPGGRWFVPAGVQNEAIEAVLGEAVAREFGDELQGRSLRVGDRFEVGPRQWVVVGILKAAGTTFSSEIWAKASLVREFGKEGRYSSMVLCTRDAATAQAATEIVRAFRQAPLWALPETEYYHKLSETNRQFLAIIVFITVVMGIGGILSVMNTMFAAITQRTQDIAILRVLGFARWQILTSFLLESLVIGLVGGSLGCALGCLANGWTVTAMVGSVLSGGTVVLLELHVDANTLALGVLLSLAMGVLGGVVPALAATRLRPLETFR